MKKNGLSIPEAMIAIFIILIGLSGISGVISKIIPIPGISSLYFEASYLAQEGIELVRNIRDENLVKIYQGVPGTTWIDNLSPPLIPSAPVPFTRIVTVIIDPPGVPPDTTIFVTARVTFSFKGKPYEFSAQEYIYQWIK